MNIVRKSRSVRSGSKCCEVLDFYWVIINVEGFLAQSFAYVRVSLCCIVVLQVEFFVDEKSTVLFLKFKRERTSRPLIA